MIHFFLSSVFFLLSFLLETSFFTSLPSLFAFTPLVFAAGVYLLQHQGIIDGLIWIIVYGFLLQVFHLFVSPMPVLVFLLGALVSALSARHLFSNRSLYGVLACALTGYASVVIAEFVILFSRSLLGPTDPVWSAFFTNHGYRTLMLMVVVLFLYTLARPIHFLFQSPR